MLSGIRTGKKKKQKKLKPELAKDPAAAKPTTISLDNENLSIAEKLRQSLAAGNTGILVDQSATKSFDQLERRGRILKTDTAASPDDANPVVAVLGMPGSFASTTLNKGEEEMTVEELAAQERRGNTMSWDEQMSRNAIRVGKKRKRKAGKNEDSDEEVERMKKLLPGQDGKKAFEKAQQRERHRLIDQHHRQEKITSQCAWWVESSRFSKHRLLALGNHVSLVMAPPNASLNAGHHFYLVPLKHASSFVDCDDNEVWEEVREFVRSLNNLYAKERKGIILCETVLPNKGFWQTKMEVIPVPFTALQDAPIFFKSAMVEQTEEWGTHNKVLSTTSQKPLKKVIPKNFAYFYLEWGNISTSSNTGYAQIIESSNFRHDFGLDTIAAMIDLDPIRMQRKKKFSFEQERVAIGNFLEGWKKFDWTLRLDDE